MLPKRIWNLFFPGIYRGEVFSKLLAMSEYIYSAISNTIKEWLSILEQSYIVLLPAWYESRTKRLVKSKKAYFYDTGLACSILGLTKSEQLKRERLRDVLFENL